MTKPDIDQTIDYRSFYGHYLTKVSISGQDMAAKCPVHKGGAERNASFSVNLKTGLYKCHGCEAAGNAYTFLEWAQGMSKEQAKATLHKAAGIVDMGSRRTGTAPGPKLSLDDYAKDKQLPVEYLRGLGLKDGRNKAHVVIPYIDENGEVRCSRRRHPKGAHARFTWMDGAKGKIIPYGVWKLRELAGQPIILVEGESDCHALWHQGVANVLGLPGAEMCRREWVEAFLMGAPEVWIHVEPGNSGEKMLRKTSRSLAEANYPGVVRTFATRGAKDPSDLHCEHGETFAHWWAQTLESLETIDPKDFAAVEDSTDVTMLPGAPFNPRTPEGWSVTPSGGVRKQSIDRSGEPVESVVCPVPVILSKRLKSIDTGEEKIEITWQRDGAWHSLTCPRSTAFTTRGIVELADRGLPVSSERAKALVSYFDALEGANLDNLPRVRSVERMGWVGSRKFLPSLCDDIVLDPPSGSEHLADAYHEHGSMDEWRNVAGPIRDAYPLARFMLAASFGATMLRDLKQRVFVVHAWGASRGGKTAALKLALSAWGEPESLMATFNSTKVGIERLAGFYNDLPLGVDERQVIGKDQNLAESLVYMLGSGKGKVRGAKQGGLQAMQAWRTIALTTGEEPLSRSNTHTGVKTRTLEIYGTPISDELRAREIHRTVDLNYGIAGPLFVRSYLAYQDAGGDPSADYTLMVDRVAQLAPNHMAAHHSAVATIALADYYLAQWLFNVEADAAWESAIDMAANIIGGVDSQEEADYAGRAVEWVESWIAQHWDRFHADDCKEPWGQVEDGVYWISPAVLESALAADGFASRRVLRDLAARKKIVTDYGAAEGRLRFKRRKTWQGSRVWMIGFRPDRTPDCDPVIPTLESSDPLEISGFAG